MGNDYGNYDKRTPHSYYQTKFDKGIEKQAPDIQIPFQQTPVEKDLSAHKITDETNTKNWFSLSNLWGLLKSIWPWWNSKHISSSSHENQIVVEAAKEFLQKHPDGRKEVLFEKMKVLASRITSKDFITDLQNHLDNSLLRISNSADTLVSPLNFLKLLNDLKKEAQNLQEAGKGIEYIENYAEERNEILNQFYDQMITDLHHPFENVIKYRNKLEIQINQWMKKVGLNPLKKDGTPKTFGEKIAELRAKIETNRALYENAFEKLTAEKESLKAQQAEIKQQFNDQIDSEEQKTLRLKYLQLSREISSPERQDAIIEASRKVSDNEMIRHSLQAITDQLKKEINSQKIVPFHLIQLIIQEYDPNTESAEQFLKKIANDERQFLIYDIKNFLKDEFGMEYPDDIKSGDLIAQL